MIKFQRQKRTRIFVSIFPRTEIRNIEVLDYVPGKTVDGNVDRETFAYLIEFGSKNFWRSWWRQCKEIWSVHV